MALEDTVSGTETIDFKKVLDSNMIYKMALGHFQNKEVDLGMSILKNKFLATEKEKNETLWQRVFMDAENDLENSSLYRATEDGFKKYMMAIQSMDFKGVVEYYGGPNEEMTKRMIAKDGSKKMKDVFKDQNLYETQKQKIIADLKVKQAELGEGKEQEVRKITEEAQKALGKLEEKYGDSVRVINAYQELEKLKFQKESLKYSMNSLYPAETKAAA